MNLLAQPSHPQLASRREFLAFVFGYLHLLAAAWDARDAQLPPRARPLALALLRSCGLDDGTLLWMLYQSHIEPLSPTPGLVTNDNDRHTAANGVMGETSSFALTEAGEEFAAIFLSEALVPGPPEESAGGWDLVPSGKLLPRYDSENRLFEWGRHVLKRFRQPSVNQEIVLRAAQELGWPAWFDDPLPGRPRGNRKVRLHDTIKDLNRRQEPFLIHFKGDGTGTRIGWELRCGLLETAPPELPQPGA